MFIAFNSRLTNFGADAQINDAICAMDSHGFGLLAHRHFLMPGHGADFLRRVYSGDFRPPMIE